MNADQAAAQSEEHDARSGSRTRIYKKTQPRSQFPSMLLFIHPVTCMMATSLAPSRGSRSLPELEESVSRCKSWKQEYIIVPHTVQSASTLPPGLRVLFELYSFSVRGLFGDGMGVHLSGRSPSPVIYCRP